MLHHLPIYLQTVWTRIRQFHRKHVKKVKERVPPPKKKKNTKCIFFRLTLDSAAAKKPEAMKAAKPKKAKTPTKPAVKKAAKSPNKAKKAKP